ncbi:urease accessory protein UreD [Halobacillus litoralis]|uniref:urease accessory protein UreD n=1 Tax=Halobacillus litoralis TaxID=45668 RepID=UPI001CFE4694|nr:urease accessory protein UreD [Halobacillus litoralis]
MSHTGFLSLQATKRDSRTVVHGFYEGAFKFTRPVKLEDDSVSIYLIHVGGGYVEGDTYFTSIHLEEGAELSVTSQASTKVYKTLENPVEQKTTIRLAPSSILEYCLDPLIMYEGAKFLQETTVEMAGDSCFFYSDIVTPGWSEAGENFRYQWYRNKLKVIRDEKLVLFDHLLLEPDEDLEGVLQLEGYTHVGSFVIFHPEASRTFGDRLYEEVASFDLSVRLGISNMESGGIVVRLLGNKTQTLESVMDRIHTFARKELLKKEKITWRKY